MREQAFILVRFSFWMVSRNRFTLCFSLSDRLAFWTLTTRFLLPLNIFLKIQFLGQGSRYLSNGLTLLSSVHVTHPSTTSPGQSVEIAQLDHLCTTHPLSRLASASLFCLAEVDFSLNSISEKSGPRSSVPVEPRFWLHLTPVALILSQCPTSLIDAEKCSQCECGFGST